MFVRINRQDDGASNTFHGSDQSKRIKDEFPLAESSEREGVSASEHKYAVQEWEFCDFFT